MLGFSWAGIAVAALLAAIGFETDWKPYLLLLVWGGAGTIYYLLRQRESAAGDVVLPTGG
jgi:APA family basic amino acid/polyamine antiporter